MEKLNPDNAVLIDQETPIGAFELKPDFNTPPTPEPGEDVEKPGFAETVEAGILHDNFLINTWHYAYTKTQDYIEASNSYDIPFNPLEQQYLDLVSPEYWPELSTVKTRGELFRKVSRIENEIHDRKVLAEGSTWGNLASGIVNGLNSPMSLIPIASALKTPNLLSGLKSLGMPLLQTTAGFAMDEAALMMTQETRSIQEAALNTASAGILSAVLGGIGVGARSLKLNTYKKLTEAAIGGEKLKFYYDEHGALKGFVGESVGAARAREFTLEGESLYGWGENGEMQVAKPFLWMTGKFFKNPVVMGLTSKSKAVRGFVNDMLEHNFEIAKVVTKSEALAEPLQTSIWTRQNYSFENEVHIANSYYERLGIDPESGVLNKAIRASFKDKKLPTLNEHITDIYKAVSAGAQGEKLDPIVKREAKRIIDKGMKPLFKDAVELGILSENVTPFGQVQHVMRMFDHESIAANRPDRKKFLISKFAETNEKIKQIRAPLELLNAEIERINTDIYHAKGAELKSLKAQKKALKEKLNAEQLKIDTNIKEGKYSPDMLTGDRTKGDLKLRAILDEQGLSDAADYTLDTILNITEEQLHQNLLSSFREGSGGPNPLMPRTLMIPDIELIENGFLSTDIRKNFAAYNLRMSRLIEMEKYLRARGFSGDRSHLEFLSSGIKQDYDAVFAQFEKKATEKLSNLTGTALEKETLKIQKERIKLNKALEEDVALTRNIYNRLMGHTSAKHGEMIKILNLTRKWAYSTQLGALLLVTLQDAVAPIYRQGFLPYFNHGILPFLKNVIKMNGANKRFAQELRNMSLGIEVQQAFSSARYDLNSNLMGPMSKVERIADGAANAMGILNGASAFSDLFSRIAGMSSETRILKDLMKAQKGKLSENSLQKLLKLGLDPKSQMAERLVKMFNAHHEKISGAYLLNTHLWEDAEARRFIQGAVKREVRATNFTGGSISSYPVGAEPNDIMGNLMMYMAWGFNATANYFLPSVQKLNVDKAMGIVAIMSVASLVEPLRAIAAGKEPDLNPDMMFKRALLNSGVLGMYGNMFNILNAMGNIAPGLRIDRFKHTRDLFAFAGEGMLRDLMSFTGAAVNGEMNKTDLKKASRLIPLTNLIYLRPFLNEGIDNLDIPETRAKAEKEGSWR